LEQDRDSQTDIGGIVLLALEEKQELHFHMFLQRSAFAEAAVGAQRLRPPTALAVAGRGKQTSLRRGRRRHRAQALLDAAMDSGGDGVTSGPGCACSCGRRWRFRPAARRQ